MYNVTLNQIAHSVFESVRGKIVDDDNISIDQIKDMVHSTRARLLKQKFDKNLRVIDDVFTQSLGSIETELVDSSIHSEIPSGKFMLKTTVDIPESIDRRIYMISNSLYHKPIQFIDIIGVFQNPSQVAQFKDSNGDSLYSDNGNYQISREMSDAMETMIIKGRIAPQSAVPSDVVNDECIQTSQLSSV